MTRRIAPLAGLRALRCLTPAALLALAGCSLLTDAPLTTAQVEVDPTPIRMIQYLTPHGWSEPEVTTKRLDELECLRPTPSCFVREAITATIHNTGAESLYWQAHCDFPLEEFGLGAWHAMHYPCTSQLVPPLVIPPGERHSFTLDTTRRRAGDYRVRVALQDEAGTTLPETMRTSQPFHYQPLPDAPQFTCPTSSEVERAGRLAREALERTSQGGRAWHPDDRILWLENGVPGIGGVYLDNSISRLVVWVKDEARFADAEAAVLSVYGRAAVARKGKFSFSEIVAWRDIIGGYLGVVPGFSSLDADEGSNRVGVGMASPLYVSDVACIARGIGMPAGILEVEVSGAITVFE